MTEAQGFLLNFNMGMIAGALWFIAACLSARRRSKQARPIISAEAAIARSLDIGDHFERQEFLTAWQLGDWALVREFLTPDLSAVRATLRS